MYIIEKKLAPCYTSLRVSVTLSSSPTRPPSIPLLLSIFIQSLGVKSSEMAQKRTLGEERAGEVRPRVWRRTSQISTNHSVVKVICNYKVESKSTDEETPQGIQNPLFQPPFLTLHWLARSGMGPSGSSAYKHGLRQWWKMSCGRGCAV